MLIDHYDLEVFTPPCEPGAERYAARARLIVDISEILPYLNYSNIQHRQAGLHFLAQSLDHGKQRFS